jgi:hypothetical protein
LARKSGSWRRRSARSCFLVSYVNKELKHSLGRRLAGGQTPGPLDSKFDHATPIEPVFPPNFPASRCPCASGPGELTQLPRTVPIPEAMGRTGSLKSRGRGDQHSLSILGTGFLGGLPPVPALSWGGSVTQGAGRNFDPDSDRLAAADLPLLGSRHSLNRRIPRIVIVSNLPEFHFRPSNFHNPGQIPEGSEGSEG